MTVKRKKNEYINGKALHEVLTKFYYDNQKLKEEGKELLRVPEFVGEAIIKICYGLANRPNFVRYTSSWKDEMIDDGIAACVYGALMFNPEKSSSNAFNYLTTIAWQAFVQRIEREKRQQYIVHSNFVKSFASIDGSILDVDLEINEVSNRIVSEFEEKQESRKQKSKEKELLKKKEKKNE